jgi:hypothetical protein
MGPPGPLEYLAAMIPLAVCSHLVVDAADADHFLGGPGCGEYQRMHVDGLSFFGQTFPGRPSRDAEGAHQGRAAVSDAPVPLAVFMLPFSGSLGGLPAICRVCGGQGRTIEWRDTPCPCIVANFPMDVTHGSNQGHTATNGATRAIPGTAAARDDPPALEDEPRWMKLQTTAPAPAGVAQIRDIRTWHAGVRYLSALAVRHTHARTQSLTRRLSQTPNLSDTVRAFPSSQWHAPWYADPQDGRQPSIPWELYRTLSPRVQLHCRFLALGAPLLLFSLRSIACNALLCAMVGVRHHARMLGRALGS